MSPATTPPTPPKGAQSSDIYPGALIRLRHAKTGAYLGSIPQRYQHPNSSGQHMVVGFAEPGELTVWKVKPPHGVRITDQGLQQRIGPNTQLRLEHVSSGRNLHSHGDRQAPINAQGEVTAFGTRGIGDSNDNWTIEAKDTEGLGGQKIRLIHVNTQGALHSHSASDPTLSCEQAFPGAPLSRVRRRASGRRKLQPL